MRAKPKVMDDGLTVTVRVPISIRRRGGRKVVLTPDGSEQNPSKLRCQHIDNAMVKAIARAFRWRHMLECGECATLREIASAEKINETYVGRVLRLTLLAPEVVEMLLNGQSGLQLEVLMRQFPVEWESQGHHFRHPRRAE